MDATTKSPNKKMQRMAGDALLFLLLAPLARHR
jgi:hypothetical protein